MIKRIFQLLVIGRSLRCSLSPTACTGVLLLALVLASCQGNTPAETAVAPTSTVQAYAATQAPPSAPAGSTEPAPEQASGAPAGCTVVSPQPTPGPTEQSLFPPVSDEDWVLGPDTASVTLIEYSDFQ